MRKMKIKKHRNSRQRRRKDAKRTKRRWVIRSGKGITITHEGPGPVIITHAFISDEDGATVTLKVPDGPIPGRLEWANKAKTAVKFVPDDSAKEPKYIAGTDPYKNKEEKQ